MVKTSEEYYTVRFAKGLVRAVYHPKEVLTIDGLEPNIKKIKSMIIASAAQPDVKRVHINKVRQLGEKGTNMKTFEMPGQLRELRAYL